MTSAHNIFNIKRVFLDILIKMVKKIQHICKKATNPLSVGFHRYLLKELKPNVQILKSKKLNMIQKKSS